MNSTFLDALSMLGMAAPFLVIASLLARYQFRRTAFKYARRSGKPRRGTYPSSAALVMAFQFLQVFYRPNIVHEIQAKLVEEVDEDDEGDPETPAKHLHRQLRRIRRGDPVDTLVVRL